ncbi:MAG: DUF1365 domain-containing protein [Opitutaceae bacterium]|nr:DUF1365 domain-containing protein [Opitutaceae bacterium]
MRSGLVPCSVMHHRVLPRKHRFVYTLFMVACDLDDVQAFSRLRGLFGINRRGLFSLRERDYLPLNEVAYPTAEAQVSVPSGASLRERVSRFAAAHGVSLASGRVVLITMPRIAGYGFNPVSFYFCWQRDGRPAGAIAEVTNTFREVKPFWVPAVAGPGNVFHVRTPKHFYVSPFSDVDVAFDFTFRVSDTRLQVQIDDYAGTTRTLTSVMRGQWRPLTASRLAWYAFKYPLLTAGVMARIHWHALRLYLKGVPWFRKASRASDQRGLFRPHSLPPPA